ncbi:MAG TPA: glycosyltransferase family 1 protein [Longimicrobium sp.]|uniref:glycosyltransferase family 4 protein n=1 Tax=Longimicrobium sp. TaxID=2029185 RepID=UPI002ED9C9F1
MKVVYDVSSLGLGHADTTHRTGIFRVVDRVARGLAASGRCDLRLSAMESVRAYGHAVQYARTVPELRGVPFTPAPAGTGLVARLDRGFHARVGAGASVPTKVVRRVLLHGRKAADPVLRAVRPPAVAGGDLFHSPRFALPAPARTRPAVRVLTVHDLIPILFPRMSSPFGIRELRGILGSLRPDDWAIAISERTRDDLCAYRPELDPARVFVIPWAADPVLFYPVRDEGVVARARARYGIPEGPYLLSLNTLEPRKNMERLVRSFAALTAAQGIRDLSLVLVGPRGLRADSVYQAARGAGPRVALAGFVPDEDLAALYSGAMAFVYPSLYEGFGLPPLEAMQCGTPVITSNSSSLPEVVGGAGLMVNPTDDDALSQAMLDVYRDSALRERLRERSLARAAEFSWARCVRQTLDAYRAARTA